MTAATIVIPTRERPAYLEVALRSIAPQAQAAAAQLVVVDDGGDSTRARALAQRFGARYVPHPRPLGLNAARNTGVERSTGELVVFVDDDVEVDPGWLEALLRAAREHPEALVFTGPIHPRLEGGRAPRSCGREGPPITSLDLGPQDIPPGHGHGPRYAWGVNMAIRRSALELAGPFDTSLVAGGDEQEWQDRLAAGHPVAGPVAPMYVAAASLHHRRAAADARLRALARTAHARGRAARRLDARNGTAPGAARELWTLAGCLGHVLRRRCPAGLVMVAHSAGRLRELVHERPAPRARTVSEGPVPRAPDAPDGLPPGPDGSVNGLPGDTRAPQDDFLSGASGTVAGVDAIRRAILDGLQDAFELASGRGPRLAAAARHRPPRQRVLVLGVQRPERRELAGAIEAELRRSRHLVEIHTRPPGGLGKFENLNLLLAEHGPEGHDWVILIDDDVSLPHGFLDRFLFLCDRFSLDLAQPAHRHRSHAAWSLTRRAWASAARETSFVEIGPLTALGPRTWSTLLPFPQLRMGWGLDAHWAALARAHGWRLGVLDAVAIAHLAAPAADSYSRAEAIAEARSFLAARPYLSATESQATLSTHRRF